VGRAPSQSDICSIHALVLGSPASITGSELPVYLAPASIMLPLAALVSPHRAWRGQVDVVSYAAKFIMGLSETGGCGGRVGVI